jgi:hypothetical protein
MEPSGRYPIHDTKYSLKNLSPHRPYVIKNAPVRFSPTPGDVPTGTCFIFWIKQVPVDVPSTLHMVNIVFWKIKVILI